MLIAIADDDPDITFLLGAFLLDNGHEVATVDNGAAALELCRDRCPDVLLMDITMPGEFNGLDVLTAIRASPEGADMPVLLLTARAGEQHIAEGMAAGATAYLVKPFEMAELLSRLADLHGDS
ncbi:response regulator transcription factor [Nocardioides sp.]|uniref:response regulator transcription factor n=1 Tax=Nocardioides sp. TaxID=35761 RepID=UPI00356903B8